MSWILFYFLCGVRWFIGRVGRVMGWVLGGRWWSYCRWRFDWFGSVCGGVIGKRVIFYGGIVLRCFIIVMICMLIFVVVILRSFQVVVWYLCVISFFVWLNLLWFWFYFFVIGWFSIFILIIFCISCGCCWVACSSWILRWRIVRVRGRSHFRDRLLRIFFRIRINRVFIWGFLVDCLFWCLFSLINCFRWIVLWFIYLFLWVDLPTYSLFLSVRLVPLPINCIVLVKFIFNFFVLPLIF